MMNEKMIAKLESKGFKRWTKGDMDRLYVDCYALGLEDGRWATMGGYDLSHADTRRVKAAKTYIDVQTGELVSDEWHCEEAAKAIYDAVIAECEAEAEQETEEEEDETMTTYSVYTELDLYCTKGIGDLDEAREIAERYAREGHEVEIRDDETGDTVELLNAWDDDKEPMEYYDMESFGADCPANWEEIASFLNGLLDERVTEGMDDRDICEIADQLWEDYWNGNLEDAPAASEELWEG